jgi:predicted membrane protein
MEAMLLTLMVIVLNGSIRIFLHAGFVYIACLTFVYMTQVQFMGLHFIAYASMCFMFVTMATMFGVKIPQIDWNDLATPQEGRELLSYVRAEELRDQVRRACDEAHEARNEANQLRQRTQQHFEFPIQVTHPSGTNLTLSARIPALASN